MATKSFHILDPEGDSFDGVENLNPTLTINGSSQTPDFRFRAADCEEDTWPPWTYGPNMEVEESSGGRDIDFGSPVLGCTSVKLSGDHYIAESDERDHGDIGTDDFVLEVVGVLPITQPNIRMLCASQTSSGGLGQGWRFGQNTSGTLRFGINGTAETTIEWSAPELETWHHIMIFVNRDENTNYGCQIFIDGELYGSGNMYARAGENISDEDFGLSIGGLYNIAYFWKHPIAYLAGWHKASWLASGSTQQSQHAAIAKERFYRMCGIWPEVAEGEETPVFERDTDTLYQGVECHGEAFIDKYEDGVRSLYKVSEYWPRVCSRYVDGAVFNGVLIEGSKGYDQGDYLEYFPVRNFFFWSNSLTDTGDWTATGASVAANETASPYKGKGCFKITSTGVDGPPRLVNATGIEIFGNTWEDDDEVRALTSYHSGCRHVVSCWMKSDTNTYGYLRVVHDVTFGDYLTAFFKLSDGTAQAPTVGGSNGTFTNTESGIEDWGNGWYRCWVSFNYYLPGELDDDIFVYIGPADSFGDLSCDNGDAILVFGPQFDEWDYPRSWIETTDHVDYQDAPWQRFPAQGREILYYEGGANLGPTGGSETRQQGVLHATVGYEEKPSYMTFQGPAVCYTSAVTQSSDALYLGMHERWDTEVEEETVERYGQWLLYTTDGGCDNAITDFCGVLVTNEEDDSPFSDSVHDYETFYQQVFDDKLVFGDQFRLSFFLDSVQATEDYCTNLEGEDDLISDLDGWLPANRCEFNENVNYIMVGCSPIHNGSTNLPHPLPHGMLINDVNIEYEDEAIYITAVTFDYLGVVGEGTEDERHQVRVKAWLNEGADTEGWGGASPPTVMFYGTNFTDSSELPPGWEYWADCLDGDYGFSRSYGVLPSLHEDGYFYGTINLYTDKVRTSGECSSSTHSWGPGDTLAITCFMIEDPLPTPYGWGDITAYYVLPQAHTVVNEALLEDIEHDGFDAKIYISGDSPATGSADLWYCNHTTVSGCDPTEGYHVELERGINVWEATVAGLDPEVFAPGDEVSWILEVTDADGVLGTNPTSGIDTLLAREDIEISNISHSAVLSNGFTVSIDYDWDTDDDATVSGYYCNETDDPDCDPVTDGEPFEMTRSAIDDWSGTYSGTVSDLESPYDPDDVVNVSVVAWDSDGVTGSPLTDQFPLSELETTVVSGVASELTYDSFEVTTYFTGDANDDNSATLFYCNETEDPGCNPLAGDSIVMDRYDGYFNVEASDLDPSYNPGDLVSWSVVVTDPDGVIGSPLDGFAQLATRNDIIISNFQTITLGETSFSFSIDYDWDMDEDATVSGYWCSETDDPGCNPSNPFALTREADGDYSGIYTATVSGLDIAYQGDLLNIKVVAIDSDGVTGSPIEEQIQLSSDALILVDGDIDNETTDSFRVTVDYLGDTNENGEVDIWYCDDTSDPGCDPLSGSSGSLTRLDATQFQGVLDDILPQDPGHTYNVQAVATDVDGVYNSPLDLGQVTLLSDNQVRFVRGDNTEFASSEGTPLTSLNLGAVACLHSSGEVFQLMNEGIHERQFTVSASSVNESLLADVEFSMNGKDWSSTVSGTVKGHGFSDTIWVRYTPSEGSVLGTGTFKIVVEVI